MKRFLLNLIGIVLVASTSGAAETGQPNVLFIIVDDLNDWVGCLGGHPQVKTPQIDRLAAMGTLFTNAHCQAPLCNPSRTSVLTGLRPSSTGIYGLKPDMHEVETLKDKITLPQTYTRAGYYTFATGKIFHTPASRTEDQSKEFAVTAQKEGVMRPKKPLDGVNALIDWGAFPERDEDAHDYKVADAAISALKDAPKDRPFFIAAGFHLPHVPCFAPQKWFDLYPEETVQLPLVLENDRDDTPRFSWYLHWRLPEPRLSKLQEANKWRSLVHAYLASTSFMDAQVGRLLDALDGSGRSKDTIIVLWSDHGWHLGEKGITGKNTLWERSTHVPLIFAGPGIATGARCSRPVELLDVFPTLLELTRFPARQELEGHSLVPLLKNAEAPREWPAITTHNHDNHSVRTERWRYIHYADGSDELYDVETDPNEWKNLAGDQSFAAVKKDLMKWLPKTNLKPVPGSASRLLIYDPVTGKANWDGKDIGRDAPIPK